MKHLPYYIMVVALLVIGGAQCLQAQEVVSQTNFVEQQESASIKFDTQNWNFGDVEESGGNVSHIFTFTNISQRPVVVLDVSASCGCTSPSFSRKPVMPGAKGEISVVFDPINRPGKFSKGVSVRLSSNERVSLNIEGNVIPRERSVDELYPFEVGAGLRLDSNFHAFSYLGRGDEAKATIVIYNTSDKDASIELRPTKSSGLLRVEAPQSIKAQALDKITLTYKVEEGSDRYGMLDDVFSVVVNGKESRTLISTHAIAVDKFLPIIDDMTAPSCELSKNFIKFGELKHGSRIEDSSVELVNDGEVELVVRAVEWKSSALTCSLKAGDKLKAGEKRKIRFAYDSSTSDYGVWVDRVSIITNDPERPMLTLRITAIVEQ